MEVEKPSQRKSQTTPKAFTPPSHKAEQQKTYDDEKDDADDFHISEIDFTNYARIIREIYSVSYFIITFLPLMI